MSTKVGQSQLDFLASQFLVQFPNVGFVGRFKTCSGVKARTGETVIYTGGSTIPRKIPNGKITVDDITLSRGTIFGDLDLYEKFKRVSNLVDERARADSNLIWEKATIYQTDRNNKIVQSWILYDVWAKEFNSGDWDADSEECLVETLILSVNRFDNNGAAKGLSLVELIS